MQSIKRAFRQISALLLAIFVVGCATGPESRTLDTAGVDPTRYNNDLYDCKLFASNYGWEQGIEKSGNMMGGALLGGAVAVATGGIFSKHTADAMVIGAAAGGVVNMANASANSKSEPIVGESAKSLVTDCMRDKGYRVVQGTAPLNPSGGNLPTYLGTAPGLAQNQSPQIAVAAPPPLSFTPVQAAPGIAAPPVSAPLASSTVSGPTPTQRYKAQAERLAKQRSCALPVTALQTAKAATVETYTTSCSNGSALLVQCERGMCKGLRP